MSLSGDATNRRLRLAGLAVVAAALALAVLVESYGLSPGEIAGSLRRIVTPGAVGRTFRLAAPIALAAIGGLYAEKSGVFNIGLEGFMIVGAISAAIAMYVVSGGDAGQGHVWLAVGVAILVTTLLTALYSVLLIRYKADQIVAGLAVWFVGLGFAPFASTLVWGSVNSGGIASVGLVPFPFAARGVSPFVLITAVLVVAAWAVLYRTRYGYWIQAAGENPRALDTAGIDVNRVRYATLVFSGAMAGFGGAVVMAHAGGWVGTGDTMVEGRGWIAIVAYLFGNYNPVGAAAAALLFGALDMLNIQFQTVGFDVSGRLMDLLPYVGVIAVLTFWGKTRMPSAVGDPYEKEE